jgi:hypothetical protein
MTRIQQCKQQQQQQQHCAQLSHAGLLQEGFSLIHKVLLTVLPCVVLQGG